MKLSIIAIGDELLIGQVTDTNSGMIARRLTPLGWTLAGVQVVHDDADAILEAVDRAMAVSDAVITTGGIGPTKDDITKLTLMRYFGGELVWDEATLANVERVVAARGLKMNELTRRQAQVPSTCQVIQNLVGTAPITWWERDGKLLFSMPGVPFETQEMLERGVIPVLAERFGHGNTIIHRTDMVTGISESLLATRLAPFEESLPPSVHLAYLPDSGIVRLRLDAEGSDGKVVEATVAECHDRLVGLIGPDHLLANRDVLPQALLIEELRSRGLTLATAESCTGGNIAHLLTEIPGCSDVLQGCVVAYSNAVKISALGVEASVLEAHGAVSEEVVRAMAEGARQRLGADCAIATSGIAGPGGATPGKPVGTVWTAIATPTGAKTRLYHLPGNRQRVITRASVNTIVDLIMELRKIR